MSSDKITIAKYLTTPGAGQGTAGQDKTSYYHPRALPFFVSILPLVFKYVKLFYLFNILNNLLLCNIILFYLL